MYDCRNRIICGTFKMSLIYKLWLYLLKEPCRLSWFRIWSWEQGAIMFKHTKWCNLNITFFLKDETIPKVLEIFRVRDFKASTPFVPPPSLKSPELTKSSTPKKIHSLLCGYMLVLWSFVFSSVIHNIKKFSVDYNQVEDKALRIQSSWKKWNLYLV